MKMPGPVCFDLGGMEPTVTDADVVLDTSDATPEEAAQQVLLYLGHKGYI